MQADPWNALISTLRAIVVARRNRARAKLVNTENHGTFWLLLVKKNVYKQPRKNVRMLQLSCSDPQGWLPHSSSSLTLSLHTTGGSKGLVIEWPLTPGAVPRSWSMTGSTPR